MTAVKTGNLLNIRHLLNPNFSIHLYPISAKILLKIYQQAASGIYNKNPVNSETPSSNHLILAELMKTDITSIEKIFTKFHKNQSIKNQSLQVHTKHTFFESEAHFFEILLAAFNKAVEANSVSSVLLLFDCFLLCSRKYHSELLKVISESKQIAVRNNYEDLLNILGNLRVPMSN